MRDGGWDTFHNFFGLKYDPSDRIVFLYLVALLLVVLTLFVINRLLRMPLGRARSAARRRDRLPLAGPQPDAHQADCFYHQRRFRRVCRHAVRRAPGSSARNPSPLSSRPSYWRSSYWGHGLAVRGHSGGDPAGGVARADARSERIQHVAAGCADGADDDLAAAGAVADETAAAEAAGGGHSRG